MRDNLVSIITPVYNAAKFIEQTIRSVQKQTYAEWEMICVDDCSTDNSVEIIERYQEKDSRIKLLRLAKNSGAAVARNTAMQNSKGRFIAFLDADDLWLPSKLEKQIAFIIKNEIGLCYCSYYTLKGDKVNIGYPIPVRRITTYENTLQNNFIGCLTVVLNKTKINVPLEMPLSRKRQDYMFWLYLLKNGVKAKSIDTPLAIYRILEDSLSAKKTSAASYNWSTLRNREKLNFFKAFIYFSYYASYNVLKRLKTRFHQKLVPLSYFDI